MKDILKTKIYTLIRKITTPISEKNALQVTHAQLISFYITYKIVEVRYQFLP